jgi:predicted dehydrogenase
MAKARLARPNVDRWMRAELEFPNRILATITCSIWSARILQAEVRVFGSQGSLTVVRPNTPHLFGRLHWSVGTERFHEKPAAGKTYEYQLRAFVSAAQHGTPVATPAADGVRNLQVIDEIYQMAGLPIRGSVPAAGQ